MIVGVILCHEFSRMDTNNEIYFVKFVQFVAEIFEFEVYGKTRELLAEAGRT